jgi:hypothetical protein
MVQKRDNNDVGEEQRSGWRYNSSGRQNLQVEASWTQCKGWQVSRMTLGIQE